MSEREIERSRAFKRDRNREGRGPNWPAIQNAIGLIVDMLRNDRPLPPRCHDHALIGNWKGYRECHIKPDLLLIYKKTDDNVLILYRLGSHAKVLKK